MFKNTLLVGAGAALAFATVPTIAFAQESAQQYEELIPEQVIVAGNPADPGYRPREPQVRGSDRLYKITRDQWVQRSDWGGTEAYLRMASRNREYCSITVDIVDEAERLMEEFILHSEKFKGHEQTFMQLAIDVDKLKGKRQGATWFRRVAGAVGITAAVVGTGGAAYPVIVGASVLGNEAVGTANDKGQDFNRRATRANIELSLANIRLTESNIRSNLLTLKMDVYWAGMTYGWCTNHHAKGVSLTSSVTRTASTETTSVPQGARQASPWPD